MSSEAPPWEVSDAYLRTVKVSDMPKPAHIETCSLSSPIVSVIKQLSSHRFLSLPVVGVDRSLQGFVSMLDVVAAITELFDNKELFNELLLRINSMQFDEKIRDMTVEDVISRRPGASAAHVIPESAHLGDVLDAMVREGTHRVGVVSTASFYSGSHQLVNIITQSRIVEFLAQHKAQLGPIVNQKIHQGHFYRDVVSVTGDIHVYEAFKLLVLARVSGVAYVSDNNRLLGEVSERDVRHALDTSKKVECQDFLLRVSAFRAKNPNEYKLEDISAVPDETIGHLLDRLNATRAHRVYVLDADGEPIGLLSLRDVIQRMIAPEHHLREFVAKKLKPAIRAFMHTGH